VVHVTHRQVSAFGLCDLTQIGPSEHLKG